MLSSFKGRVALAAAILAAVGTMVVVTLQSHLSENGMTEAVIAQQQSLSERVATDANGMLLLAQASMSELASAVPEDAHGDPQALQRYLSNKVGIRPLFQAIQVFDLKGHWVASMPPLRATTRNTSVADREWFRQSLEGGGRKVISKPLMSRLSGRPIVVMTAPIFDEYGVLKALLVSTLDLTSEIMLGSIAEARIGKNGYFILLARDGSIIMHHDRRFVTKNVEQLGKAAQTIAAGLAQPQLSALEAEDQFGVRSLFTFAKVPTADWVLVGVQPYGEALAALNRLWKQMLIAGILLSLLLIPFIWALVSRMLQPLDALRRDIARLRDGEPIGTTQLLDGHGALELREVRNEFGLMAQARRAAEVALQREKEMMEVTLHSIGDAVIVTDAETRIRSMNAVAESITGWQREEAAGRYFSDVFCVSHEETGMRGEDVAKRAIQEKSIATLPADTVLRAKNGREVPVEDSAAPILDDEGKVHGAVVVFRDVGVQRAAAREISWRATHDALTRLPNRGAFETALETAVTAMGEDSMHAVLMLDLDQFKIVNDTCGHAAGDELLKRLAALFQSRIRKSDLVARLGGDEFAVLMYHCPADKSMRLAEELRRSIAEMRFTWEENVFRVGASIGLVAVEHSYKSAVDVQKAADMACYMAKRSGRNRICVHSRDDHQLELMRHEMQAVSRIQQAIDENRLRVFAQHIIPVMKQNETGEHLEVLVRMVDDEGHLIPPGAFLPAAERYGLMDE
ncbi:MAG TPA: diguanylate cyclase, partial [Burkholderiales bacterium]|nr:diguanylate cyclase [Burkholderiales bacterium]